MRSKITTVAIGFALVRAFFAPASAAQAASATVSGTVEYKGKPVAGILVGWFKPGTGRYRSVKTANDGTYSLDLPSAGQEYDVVFSIPGQSSDEKNGDKGYLPESTEVTGVTETSKIIHNAVLATGGRVRGKFPNTSTESENTLTLLGPDGKVLNGDYFYPVDGAFNVGSLKSGSYTAYFTNHVGSEYGKRSFTVKAGKTTELGKITRTKKGVSLSGTVPNFNQAPTGYYTTLWATKVGGPNYFSYVDSKGKYSVKGLVPGTYKIQVFSEGREAKVYSLKVTKNTVKTLSVGTKWGSVKATFSVDGLPVPKGTLDLGERFNDWAGPIADGAWKLTAPSGTYKTIAQFETTSVFQANSPNWLTLPEGMLSVTVRAGTTKNLGPVALTAH